MPIARKTQALLLVLAAGLLGILLISCGAREKRAPDGSKIIEVWQGFNTEETAVFKDIMKDFQTQWNDTHEDDRITVEVSYVSYGDMFTKLRTAALAKITPDVAFMDSIKVTDLAFGRGLVALDELEGFKSRYGTVEKARAEFVGASFNAGVVNRLGEARLYALPVQTTTVALFWNREMFRNKAAPLKAAGLDPNRPPRDWDEMIAYGNVLTDREKGVYAYGMSSSLWFNFPVFNMYNVEWIDYAADGRASARIDSPNAEAALETIRRLAHSGVEGGAWKRSALSPDAGFINRKYAMILTGPWNVEPFSNAGLDFDIALIPAPTQEEIERLDLRPSVPGLKDSLGQMAYSSSNVGGQSGVILRECQNQAVAYEMIEYFTSEPVQRRWASQLGQIPVRLAAWKDLDTTKYPFMPKFMEQLRLAKRIPQIPLYGVLENDIYNPEIDLLLQGGGTSSKDRKPKDMLGSMNAKMEDKILRKMNEAL
ncbi:extracellular solute-binding protein [Candidatus Poribacteria bacterium]|nr:extracellular solute-binding protein [Candidatus Poribacteria bacterium]